MRQHTTSSAVSSRPGVTRGSARRVARGITIVEMLAVVGVIALLLAILLPAVSLARRNAQWATSQANLRQVGQLLVLYAGENRDAVVPTAFDYRSELAPGKTRTASPPGTTPPLGPVSYGTWTDILWTAGKFGPVASIGAADPSTVWDYRFDSPDASLYATGWSGTNPFRSAIEMDKLDRVVASGGQPILPGRGAVPFGDGPCSGDTGSAVDSAGDPISEKGHPGYFGGNPFFDARGGKFWALGQIKRPQSSMYCIDSSIGELVFLNEANPSPNNPNLDLVGVDFRYSGRNALVLFLDGHVDTVSEFDGLRELEVDLGVRVLDLDKPRFYPTN
jgi:prepilin-type processing-associated H-X9-DG protein